jgi:hypothetical protein
MPEVYDRLARYDRDFSKYQADIVVVNLFQNDSWIVTSQTRNNLRQGLVTRSHRKKTLLMRMPNSLKHCVAYILKQESFAAWDVWMQRRKDLSGLPT